MELDTDHHDNTIRVIRTKDMKRQTLLSPTMKDMMAIHPDLNPKELIRCLHEYNVQSLTDTQQLGDTNSDPNIDQTHHKQFPSSAIGKRGLEKTPYSNKEKSESREDQTQKLDSEQFPSSAIGKRGLEEKTPSSNNEKSESREDQTQKLDSGTSSSTVTSSHQERKNSPQRKRSEVRRHGIVPVHTLSWTSHEHTLASICSDHTLSEERLSVERKGRSAIARSNWRPYAGRVHFSDSDPALILNKKPTATSSSTARVFYTIPSLDEEKSTNESLTSPGGSSSSRDFLVNRVDSGEKKTCDHNLVLPSVFPQSTEDVNTQERKVCDKKLSLPSVFSQFPHTVCSSLCEGEQRFAGEELVSIVGEQRVSGEALVPTVGEQRVSGEALVQMQGSSHPSECLQSSQSLPKVKNGSDENLEPACRRSFSSRDRNFSSNSEQSSEYKSSGSGFLPVAMNLLFGSKTDSLVGAPDASDAPDAHGDTAVSEIPDQPPASETTHKSESTNPDDTPETSGKVPKTNKRKKSMMLKKKKKSSSATPTSVKVGWQGWDVGRLGPHSCTKLPTFIQTVPQIRGYMDRQKCQPVPKIHLTNSTSLPPLSEYMALHHVEEIFDILMINLLEDRPADPLDYMLGIMATWSELQSTKWQAEDEMTSGGVSHRIPIGYARLPAVSDQSHVSSTWSALFPCYTIKQKIPLQYQGLPRKLQNLSFSNINNHRR